MKKLFFLFVAVVLLSSCHKDIKGVWKDNINLSVKNVVFGPQADSVTITTGGSWWWIDGITFNDSSYCTQLDKNYNPEMDRYTFKQADYVVEKRDKQTLFAKLDKNTTGKDRTLIISLQAGDYFDCVTIKQSAK